MIYHENGMFRQYKMESIIFFPHVTTDQEQIQIAVQRSAWKSPAGDTSADLVCS